MCRPAFLLTFILAGVAVMSVDRYLVTDAVKLCGDSNRYNCEELAQIRATQNAQVCVGYGLRIAEALADQLKQEKQVSELTIGMAKRLAEENRQLSHCQTVINNYNDKLIRLLDEKGIELPEPDAEPAQGTPTPAPAAEDRST